MDKHTRTIHQQLGSEYFSLLRKVANHHEIADDQIPGNKKSPSRSSQKGSVAPDSETVNTSTSATLVEGLDTSAVNVVLDPGEINPVGLSTQQDSGINSSHPFLQKVNSPPPGNRSLGIWETDDLDCDGHQHTPVGRHTVFHIDDSLKDLLENTPTMKSSVYRRSQPAPFRTRTGEEKLYDRIKASLAKTKAAHQLHRDVDSGIRAISQLKFHKAKASSRDVSGIAIPDDTHDNSAEVSFTGQVDDPFVEKPKPSPYSSHTETGNAENVKELDTERIDNKKEHEKSATLQQNGEEALDHQTPNEVAAISNGKEATETTPHMKVDEGIVQHDATISTPILRVSANDNIEQKATSSSFAERFLNQIGDTAAAAQFSPGNSSVRQVDSLKSSEQQRQDRTVSSNSLAYQTNIATPITAKQSELPLSAKASINKPSPPSQGLELTSTDKQEYSDSDRKNVSTPKGLSASIYAPRQGSSSNKQTQNRSNGFNKYKQNGGFVKARDISPPPAQLASTKLPDTQPIDNVPSQVIKSSLFKASATVFSTRKTQSPSQQPTEIPHTPTKLIEYLRATGITSSSNRPVFKSRKGKDPKFIYEKYLLDNLKGYAPYDIFNMNARDLKAKQKADSITEDPAIVPGAKFDYGLPPWVSKKYGRLYVWKSARNLRLGLEPLNRTEYENLVAKYIKEGKTYQEITADEAFERGEWDIAAEMRKPENRDTILEHERQLQTAFGTDSVTAFNYEDYILPEAFKLRMIKCLPRTDLIHELRPHSKVEDLPPHDKIRLDIDYFVKDEDCISIGIFDAVENKYPECAIPLHPLWQSTENLKLSKEGNVTTRPTRLHTEQGDDLPLLMAAPLYWSERKHDLGWTTSIQKPRIQADLDAHGCFLYMNPKLVGHLSDWLDEVVDLALNDPCRVDVNTKAFRNGIHPTTGLARPYFPYPSELFGEDSDSFYGPPLQAPDLDEIVYEEDRGFDPIQTHDEHMPWTVDHSVGAECRMYVDFLTQQYKLKHKGKGTEIGEQADVLDAVSLVKNIRLSPFKANPESKIQPEISMFVRPAMPEDSEAFINIYNHWLKNSNSVQSNDRWCTEAFFEGLLEKTSYGNLPFFVACASKMSRNNGSDESTKSSYKDNIIGFCYALPWSTSGVNFSRTYELFILSSPIESQQRSGIGNVLLDRLMTAMDKEYKPEFPTHCHDTGLATHMFQPGGLHGNAARKLLANIYFTDDEVSGMLWKRDWLNKWGWKQNALMSEIGDSHSHQALHLLTMGYDIGRGGERGSNEIEGQNWKQWGLVGGT